jgi:hypothetical protein
MNANACGVSVTAARALPPATSSSRSAWAAGSATARGALLRRPSASSGRRRDILPPAPRAGVSGAELPPRKIAMALALQEAGAWEEMPRTRRSEGGQLERRPAPQEDTWTLEDASGYTGLGRDENKDAERRWACPWLALVVHGWGDGGRVGLVANLPPAVPSPCCLAQQQCPAPPAALYACLP